MSLEAKVGAFVVSGLILLFVLSTQVNDLGSFNEKGTYVNAYIQDASGLEQKTKVKLNGVEIGYIDDITLVNHKVKLRFFVREGIMIPADSSVVVTQDSVLGGKLINITPGHSSENIGEEGVLKAVDRLASFEETSESVDQAAQEIKLFVSELRQTFDAQSRHDLQSALKEFAEVGKSLREVISENRSNLYETIDNFKVMGETVNNRLPDIMAQFDSLSKRFDSVGETLDTKLPAAMDKFISLEDNLTQVVQENKKPLNDVLLSADSFFSNGGEAFKKVDKMLSNFTKSELQFGINSHYMFSDEYAKTYVDINYLPDPSTYYMFSVISMNDYTKTDANNDFVEPVTHDKDKYYLSAQYGKRYDDLLFRAGLIETTGGVGVDYFAMKDNLKFSLEGYDLNAVNDFRNNRAHMRFNMRYRFLKHLEVHAGWDNFLNTKADNFYLGFGASFSEESMKYLLSSVAGAAR
ncbi:MAG: MCE family protein [Campylobacterales bacterium]|nr:MCE family protein [Campylobacterales bacterium]